MSHSDEKITTRVLVSSKQLAEMIAHHPEIEIELMRKAVPQLAEQVKRKIDSSGIKNEITREIDNFVNDRYKNYSMPVSVKAQIQETIDKTLTPRVIEAAVTIATARVELMIDSWIEKNETFLKKVVTEKVHKLVITRANALKENI